MAEELPLWEAFAYFLVICGMSLMLSPHFVLALSYGSPVQNYTLYVGVPVNWTAQTNTTTNETCNFTSLPVGYSALNVTNASGGQVHFENVSGGGANVSLNTTERGANDSSLVGWWWLDGNASDYSGNGNNGTVFGAIWTASGKTGGAYEYDGSTSYIDAGNNPSVQLNDSVFAYSAWVKFAFTPSINFILVKESLSPPYYEGYMLAWAYGSWYNVNGNAANTMGGGCGAWSPTPGQWYYVVFTGNGSVAKTYLDGVELCSSTYTPGYPTDTTDNLLIGKRSDGYYFNGSLDEVRIYNRSLSASEIADTYYKEGSLKGWWKLDNDSATQADSSSFGNNGTVNGATFNASGQLNGSYDFNGASDFISVTDDASLRPVEYTGMAWVKADTLTALTFYEIMGQDATDSNTLGRGYQLTIYDDKLYFLHGSGDGGWETAAGGTALPTGAWFHVAYRKNATDITVFLNGTQDGTTANAQATSYGTPQGFFIGKYGGGSGGALWFFDGAIDDARVYAYALNDSEIQSIYNNGTAGSGGGTTYELGFLNGSSWCSWWCNTSEANYTLYYNTSAPTQSPWSNTPGPNYTSTLSNPSNANYTNIVWSNSTLPVHWFSTSANPHLSLLAGENATLNSSKTISNNFFTTYSNLDVSIVAFLCTSFLLATACLHFTKNMLMKFIFFAMLCADLTFLMLFMWMLADGVLPVSTSRLFGVITPLFAYGISIAIVLVFLKSLWAWFKNSRRNEDYAP